MTNITQAGAHIAAGPLSKLMKPIHPVMTGNAAQVALADRNKNATLEPPGQNRGWLEPGKGQKVNILA